jgi:hypothetical protein
VRELIIDSVDKKIPTEADNELSERSANALFGFTVHFKSLQRWA